MSNVGVADKIDSFYLYSKIYSCWLEGRPEGMAPRPERSCPG